MSPGILDARFSPNLRTHSEYQRFCFDAATGLLRQHDYTALAMGGWAKAAMVILEHSSWNGIPYSSLRRGTPRRADDTARGGPVIIEIQIHEWRLMSSRQEAEPLKG